MTVLILANSDSGLIAFRKELLERLLSLNYHVVVSSPSGERLSELKKLGCSFVETKIQRRGKNPFSDISLFFRYLKIIRCVKPSIILTYTVKPNVYGGMACKFSQVPFISNVTGLGTSVENGGVLGYLVLRLYRIGLRKASCVFFQNERDRNSFKEKSIFTGKNRLISGSGVNLERFSLKQYPLENSLQRFLFVGRIMKDKGICELLEVAKDIKKTWGNVQFDLVGSFDEDFNELINNAVSKGYVNYYGHKQDVRPFYDQCWAVVMPSYHEGMCNVCLEAAFFKNKTSFSQRKVIPEISETP